MINYIIYEGKYEKPKKESENKKEKKEDKKEGSRWQQLLQLIAGMESPKTDILITNGYYPAEQLEELPKTDPKEDPNYIPETPAPLWTPQEVRKVYSDKLLDKNIKLAYNELTEKWRFSPEVASGIIGNLICENLANPTLTVADSRGTTAFGIASFNSSGRLPDFENFINTHNLDKNNLAHQLAYIASSIHKEKPLQVLRDSTLTPEQASELFGRHFEVFAGADGKGYKNYNDSEHMRRKKSAREVYYMFNN